MPIIQPLDFEEVIIGKLIGGGALGAIIFAFLGLLVLTIMSAKFRIPGGAYIIMVITFSFVFFSTEFLAEGTIRFLIALIGGGVALIISKSFNKAFS